MSVIPTRPLERVQFYENHIAPFTTNATAIGISSAEATDLQTKSQAARTAYDAQQAALQSAKVATESFQNAVAAMTTTGAALVKKIRAKAEMSGDPNVYTLAQIPAPPTPAPRPAPGKPYQMVVTLADTGALTLKWKCNNPAGSSGTIYQIWRQIGEAGTNEYLGGSGTKLFVDQTLPAGSNNVLYQIQGVRSTAVGEFATFTVKFGVGSSGEMTASISEGNGPKKVAA